MSNDLKPIGTDIRDITDKVKVPDKLPIPPKVDLPNTPGMDASTSLLEDSWLWFRNRLKRMGTAEGQGIDAGKLLPSVGGIFSGIVGIVRYWPFLLALLVIVGILFALKVF